MLAQLRALLDPEVPALSNISNTVALLNQTFRWWWTGFYIVHQNSLVLGPFQGPVACTRIEKGKGVCGTSWQTKESLIVPDVHLFPGHIACSAESQSEIVIPVIHHNEVVAVLDVDSEHRAFFDETDKQYLEQVAVLVAPLFQSLVL